MVDSASEKRHLAAAKRELHNIVRHDELQKKPILVIGNKIDLSEAASEEELTSLLGPRNDASSDNNNLRSSSNKRGPPVKVCMCSVKHKMGYADGFRWLYNELTK